MKNYIIFIYIFYIIILSLLWVIDVNILIYYIFWINNVFISPLLWLCIKILFYNRTVLLLLIFYYLIAKFTIKELGYKYFYFFNIDIRRWRALYLSYIWKITSYHIELISIFFFFSVILIPLVLYNKDVFFLMCCIIIFLLIWLNNLNNRLIYIKEKRIRYRNFFFYLVISVFFFKFFDHQFIKEFYTMYIHLDKWVFELLEWKIQMYNKVMEKDYYSDTVGLKPLWVGEKINNKEKIDNKLWDILYKKKKNKFLVEFKYKLKRAKRKYYLYAKYYERVSDVKNSQSMKKIDCLRKEFLLKNFINRDYFDKIIVKEYTPKKIIKNENPVVTQEKEKERLLHRTVVSNIIQKFSLKNYYRLNILLKELTNKQLYYQPFFDKKGFEKQKIQEKRNSFYLHIREGISLKEDLNFFKKVISKIKKNELILLKDKNEQNYSYFDKINVSFIDKLYKYLIIEKFDKNLLNKALKVFNIKNEDEKLKKKKVKLSVSLFLKNMEKDVNFKKKINKLYFFNECKKSVMKKEKIEDNKKRFCSFPTYIEKEKLEKMDNKVLFSTVKKYNEEKTKENLKSEFNDFFILKEKKENLRVSDSPDLSRRNKK